MPHDLNDAEFWSRHVVIDVSVFQLVTLHGLVVLALKHPNLSVAVLDRAASMVGHFERLLVSIGAVTADELARMHETDYNDVEPANGKPSH